jgi:citrate lyase subunit gamma (acyl carrier protein)
MKILKRSIAGTLESCDIQIHVNPHSGRKVTLDSPVAHLYEEHILGLIDKLLNDFNVEDVSVHAIDKGALDCTIKARVACALTRASEEKQ